MADTTTQITVSIPPYGFEELAQLTAHAERLEEILQVTAGLGANLDLASASKAVSERLKIEPDDAQALLSGLATLLGMANRTSSRPEELIRAITQTLPVEAPEDWLASNFEKWSAASDKVAAANGTSNSRNRS